MLSETTRRIVTDGSVDDNQRFKALLEELYWARKLSTYKVAEKLNIKCQTTLWNIVKRLNVRMRDKKTALQVANTGKYKYPKCDFNGSDAEKLKLWFLAHTDGSVQLKGQQVKVILGTPDPYLAFLFKNLFARYGHVGIAPYKDNRGRYVWQLWVLLPLSFKWLLEKRVPAPLDESGLYDALGVAIDAEGSIIARKLARRRTTMFSVALSNEKEYVIKPLYQALARLGYNPRPGKVSKGKITNYGALNGDYHYFRIYDKFHVKRLLENVELVLPHKRLKAHLIKCALSDPTEPVYWKDIEQLYAESNAIYEEMLTESKELAKALYAKWHGLRGLWKSDNITWEQHQEERVRLEAEAWSALQGLKARYDEKFSDLERRIKDRFRARRPQASPQGIKLLLNALRVRPRTYLVGLIYIG